MPDQTAPDPLTPDQLAQDQLTTLLAAEPFEISQAMRQLGSHFYRALAEAFDRADPSNRRLILRTWTTDILTLLERARAAERGASESSGVDSAP